MEREYRPNVAALLLNGRGEVLVAERIDFADSWQFPQGGVDEGETLAQALEREMEEELGLEAGLYDVIETRGGYRYEFPGQHRRWNRYVGQEQTYFRCRFLGAEADIRLDRHKPEFARWKWVAPADFQLGWLPAFKRPVYQRVMRDFFGVNLPLP